MFKHHLDIHRTTHITKPHMYRHADTILPRYRVASNTYWSRELNWHPVIECTTQPSPLQFAKKNTINSADYLRGFPLMSQLLRHPKPRLTLLSHNAATSELMHRVLEPTPTCSTITTRWHPTIRHVDTMTCEGQTTKTIPPVERCIHTYHW